MDKISCLPRLQSYVWLGSEL